MDSFAYHVFVCVHPRHDYKPTCLNHGAEEIVDELHRLIEAQGLQNKVQVTPCGCLGLCHQGPNMVVYPEGTWYSGVSKVDLPEILQSHFINGKPVVRLAHQKPQELHQQILREHELTKQQEMSIKEAGVLPSRLRRLAGSFQACRALLSAVELDVFSAISEEGSTAQAIAEKIGTDPRATEILLNALASLGLLHKAGTNFINTPDADRYLRRGAPDDSIAAIRHWSLMWDRWSTLTECIREGSPMMSLDDPAGPFATTAYLAATHKIASLNAPLMISALGLTKVKRVLDVGGGSGAYLMAALHAFPEATGELFDLPTVIRSANRYVREAGMESRITMRAGNFHADPLGAGFDLVILSYVTHLNNPSANHLLLKKVQEALVPGGLVVINDYLLNEEKTSPRTGVLHSLHLLVSSRGGTVYSEKEYFSMLREAGFQQMQKVSLWGPTDVVTALKKK